jgi:excisionase family DNA binding protein
VNDVLDSVTNWLTVPEAAEELNVPLGRVRRMLEEHQLIAARRDGVLKIPAEVIVDGEPLASLQGTMIVLLDCVLTEQEAVEWLYTFDDSLPGTPMEFLLKGHKSAVRRLAMLLA